MDLEQLVGVGAGSRKSCAAWLTRAKFFLHRQRDPRPPFSAPLQEHGTA